MADFSSNFQSNAFQIQTLAFLDLETTGLLRQNHMPRITEFALVAIDRDEFVRSVDQMREIVSRISNVEMEENAGASAEKFLIKPRLLNKILQAINPEIPIDYGASKISGISHAFLSKMPTFPQFATVLWNFLEKLPKPICLIAHNGFNFDFPILKLELRRSNVEVNAGIFCADSIQIFKNIDDSWENEAVLDTMVTQVEETVIQQETQSTSPVTQAIYRTRFVSINGSPGSNYETSPSRPRQSINNLQSTTPEHGGALTTTPDRNVRRQLFTVSQANSPAKWKYFATQKNGAPINGVNVSYSLKAVYQRMFNGMDPPAHHSAEADCMSILQISGQYGEDFLLVVDSNATPFAT